MAIWTKAQQNYINDIEKTLNTKFIDTPSRTNASNFIKKYKDQYTKFKLDNNKRFPPTMKQRRLIKDIENTLNIKYNGKTVKTASTFIKKHYNEFTQNTTEEYKFKKMIEKKANDIQQKQDKRRKNEI